MSEFETKDSGQRVDLANGMVRDTSAGKMDWTLLLDGPMLERWAALLGRGAVKYQPRNWCLALKSMDPAAREETKQRFKESTMRHMMQWLMNDRSEDHAAAVFFNLNGYEAMLETDHVCTAECLPLVVKQTTAADVGPVFFAGKICGCNECQSFYKLNPTYPKGVDL